MPGSAKNLNTEKVSKCNHMIQKASSDSNFPLMTIALSFPQTLKHSWLSLTSIVVMVGRTQFGTLTINYN